MNITFTTVLPIEAIDNGYYTIATNGKVGQNALLGFLKQRKVFATRVLWLI